MPTLTQARKHYQRQRKVAAVAVAAVRALLGRTRDPQAVAASVAAYQLLSATTAARSVAAMNETLPLSRPAAFAGTTSAGFLLTDPLEPMLASLEQEFLDQVDRFVASEVQDAGRAAAQVEIVARPEWTNYVRMLNLPSCARCAILGGRIYRDLDAFQRHPLCDCVMVPVTGWEQAHDEGLVSSAEDAFDRGLIRGLSHADHQAITDGADIGRVVNAAQGMSTADVFNRRGVKTTLTGTSKRSAWRRENPDRLIRLRPEAIYAAAKDTEDAIRLLRLYGYLTS